MNYSDYLIITISVAIVVLFVLNILTQLSDGFNGFDVIGMIPLGFAIISFLLTYMAYLQFGKHAERVLRNFLDAI